MWQLLVVIGLQVAAAIITFITASGLIHKQPEGQIFGRKPISLSTKGWVLATTYLVIIAFSIWQFHEQKEEKARADTKQSKRELESQLKLKERDSIAELRSNRRNDSTVKTMIDALARYNLRIDSTSGEIIKYIRDSARRTTITGPDPSFNFCAPNGIQLKGRSPGKYTFEIGFCSEQAPASGFQLKLFFVMESVEGKYLLIHGSGQQVFPYASVIPVSAISEHEYTIYLPDSLSAAHFILIGNYRDITLKKVYSLESIHTFDLRDNKHVTPGVKPYDRIRGCLIKEKILKS